MRTIKESGVGVDKKKGERGKYKSKLQAPFLWKLPSGKMETTFEKCNEGREFGGFFFLLWFYFLLGKKGDGIACISLKVFEI